MKKSIALVMAMLFMALVAGCGGGNDTAIQVGSWKLTSMEQNGEAADLSQLDQLGMTGILTLSEDKKATMDMFGESISGTWEASGENGVKFTFEGATNEGTIADNKLTMEQDGTKLIFEKMAGGAESPAAS